MTEGSVSDFEIEEAKDISFKVTIKVPIIHPHNLSSPTYNTYTFTGASLDGISDPRTWVADVDLGDTFMDGLTNGIIVGLLDQVSEELGNTLFNRIIGSKLWRTKRWASMKTWIDKGTNKIFRIRELSGAFDFEQKFKIFLKPASTKTGDFVGLVGKYKNKVFDHFGTTRKGLSFPNNMKLFKNSVDKHFKKLEKGVDYLILDFKHFSKDQIKEIKGYINKTYKEQTDKIFYLNDK